MDEFEELRKVDYEYRRETIMDESEKLKLALDFLGTVIYCTVLLCTVIDCALLSFMPFIYL